MLPTGTRPLLGRSRQSPGPGFPGAESEKLLPEIPSCSPGSGCSSRRRGPADITAVSGSLGLPAESSPPLPYSSKEAGSRIQGPLLLGRPSQPLGLDCWALATPLLWRPRSLVPPKQAWWWDGVRGPPTFSAGNSASGLPDSLPAGLSTLRGAHSGLVGPKGEVLVTPGVFFVCE